MRIVIFIIVCCILMGTYSASCMAEINVNSFLTADSSRNNFEQKQIEATLFSGGNIAVGFGYGFKQNYDFGINIRGGISSESRVYVGGIFNYNLGRSLTQTFDSTILSVEKFAYSISGELGYDVLIEKKAILRPSLAIGFITFRDITDIRGKINFNQNETESHLLICPGLFLQCPLNRDVFWGAELRYNIVTGNADFNSFALYTNFLFRF